jgi:hypothetical protein
MSQRILAIQCGPEAATASNETLAVIYVGLR